MEDCLDDVEHYGNGDCYLEAKCELVGSLAWFCEPLNNPAAGLRELESVEIHRVGLTHD